MLADHVGKLLEEQTLDPKNRPVCFVLHFDSLLQERSYLFLTRTPATLTLVPASYFYRLLEWVMAFKDLASGV